MENNLPKGWSLLKMSDICDVRDGTHDSPKYHDTGYPLVTSKNLKSIGIDFSNINYISEIDYKAINKRSKVDVGDILFAMIGTIGNPVIIRSEPNFAIKNMALFKPKNNILSDYICYYLSSQFVKQKMTDEANGATQKFVGLGYLRTFPIPFPPLPEQQCIVSKLDSLFERIDKSIALVQENIKLAENLMASVLDEVFGVIEKSLFKPIFDINSANNVTISPKEGTTYNYIALENIESNTGRLIDFNSSKGETIKSSKVKFEKGAVLYGKLRPYLNKVWVATFDGICTTEILPFNPNEKILNSNFLSYYLRSPKFVDFVNSNTSGARMPRATTSFFKTKAKVPIPNLEIQEKIVKKLDLAFDKHQTLIQELQIQLSNFNALKSSLLDSAFKGEL